jgi:(2Fe-2S) ferredoxin
MNRPQYHMMVCNSFRVDGTPKGICNKKDAPGLIQYLEQEIIDRGLDVLITAAGCLKQCDKGPVLVVYPDGHWYGPVNEAVIDDILDALENDEPAEAHLIA